LQRKLGTKLKYGTTCHPQTDGQTEVTNRTLGTLLKALIKPHTKACDLLFPHAGFACNKALSKATDLSLFKVVYGIDPISPLDLTSCPLDQNPSADTVVRVEEIQKIHKLVRSRIEKTNASYQVQANKHKKKMVFQPGDLV